MRSKRRAICLDSIPELCSVPCVPRAHFSSYAFLQLQTKTERECNAFYYRTGDKDRRTHCYLSKFPDTTLIIPSWDEMANGPTSGKLHIYILEKCKKTNFKIYYQYISRINWLSNFRHGSANELYHFAICFDGQG